MARLIVVPKKKKKKEKILKKKTRFFHTESCCNFWRARMVAPCGAPVMPALGATEHTAELVWLFLL